MLATEQRATLQMLQGEYGKAAMKKMQVYNWQNIFMMAMC
jgi:hypothetical protein